MHLVAALRLNFGHLNQELASHGPVKEIIEVEKEEVSGGGEW